MLFSFRVNVFLVWSRFFSLYLRLLHTFNVPCRAPISNMIPNVQTIGVSIEYWVGGGLSYKTYNQKAKSNNIKLLNFVHGFIIYFEMSSNEKMGFAIACVSHSISHVQLQS